MAYTIVSDLCEGCADCVSICPEECIFLVQGTYNRKRVAYFAIDPDRCTDCGACLSICPISGAVLDTWHPDLMSYEALAGPMAQWSASLEKLLPHEGKHLLDNCRTLRSALGSGLDPDVALPLFVSLLRQAAMFGKVEAFEILIGAKADLTKRVRGNALIHDAAYGGSIDIVRKLLLLGANPNDRTDDGEVPFELAFEKGDADLLRVLIAGGADHRGAKHATTLLHLAAALAKPDICALLVELGLDPNAQDELMATPLHSLATGYHARIPNRGTRSHVGQTAVVLIGSGANINAADNLGQTPLMLAVDHYQSDMVSQLLLAGADVNLCDRAGRTVLHSACKCLDTSLARSFLEKGGNPNAQDIGGSTPLHFMLRRPCYSELEDGETMLQLLKLFLDRGADPTIPDGLGSSIIQAAAGAPLLRRELEARGYRKG